MPDPALPATLRNRTHALLAGENRLGRWIQALILSLIALNVAALTLETVESIRSSYGSFFLAFETFSVVIFSIEYLLRLWTCVEDSRFSSPFLGRIRFALTPLALIDLVAILPFFLPALNIDLRFARLFRFIRLFRIAKVGRYSRALQTLLRVLKSRREQLVTTLAVLLVLIIVASSVMFLCENSAQPEAFSSIPATMWWAIATITTIGYGDVYPITPLGKAVASIVGLLGVAIFALPTGILGAGFTEEFEREEESKCPHCGKGI